MKNDVSRSENNLLVFISSRMNSEMEPARKIAVEAVNRVEFGQSLGLRIHSSEY